jgi:hypothetical protein
MTWLQTWGGSVVGNRGERTDADAAAVGLGFDYGSTGGSLSDFLNDNSGDLGTMGGDAPPQCEPCDEAATNGHVQLPPVTSTLNKLKNWRQHVVIPD